MRKRPMTINVDAELRARIETVRIALTIGTMQPTMGEVVREAIWRGLEALLKEARGGK